MKPTITTLVRAAAVGAVLPRLARAARMRPPVSAAGDGPGRTDRTISVVIPARNESSRLQPLLDRIIVAPDVVEVIVVDDDSTDDTAEIAARAGCRVIAAGSRPVGWTGKTWALQRGLDEAKGEWIVTLDADTRPHPGLPVALVARALADGSDLLTVAGRFVGRSAPARWLHAAMLTTLVYRFGPPGQSPAGPPDRVLANGQCMTFRRQSVLAAMGLTAVGSAVVEDVALARYLARSGKRVDFLDAGGLLDVELYGSFADTWRGWGRSIGLPGVDSTSRRMLDVVVLALTMPVPLLRLAVGRPDAIDLVALAARLGTLVGTRTAFDRNDAAYWTSPLADALAVAALATSLLPRPHTWSGRAYPDGVRPRPAVPVRPRPAVRKRRPTNVIRAPVAAVRCAPSMMIWRTGKLATPSRAAHAKPSAEFLMISHTIRHMATATSAGRGANTSAAPTNVSTLRPPLSRDATGQAWPTIAAAPAM